MKRVNDLLWGGLDEPGVAYADPLGDEEQTGGR
jgi:hypothetical protein